MNIRFGLVMISGTVYLLYHRPVGLGLGLVPSSNDGYDYYTLLGII